MTTKKKQIDDDGQVTALASSICWGEVPLSWREQLKAMECFLNPWRTRTFFKCLSFGAILLWILCGSYVRHEPVGATIHADREGELGRHLLSTSEKQLEVGGANFECEDLYYSKSGKSVQSVDKEDKVSAMVSSFFVVEGLWLLILVMRMHGKPKIKILLHLGKTGVEKYPGNSCIVFKFLVSFGIFG